MSQKKSASGNDNSTDELAEYEAYTIGAKGHGTPKWLLFQRSEVIPDGHDWPPAHLMFMKHYSNIEEMWFNPTEELDEFLLVFRDNSMVTLKGGNFDKKGKYGISLIDGFWKQRVNGIYQLSRHSKYPSGEEPWIGVITIRS